MIGTLAKRTEPPAYPALTRFMPPWQWQRRGYYNKWWMMLAVMWSWSQAKLGLRLQIPAWLNERLHAHSPFFGRMDYQAGRKRIVAADLVASHELRAFLNELQTDCSLPGSGFTLTQVNEAAFPRQCERNRQPLIN
ncbi:UNVERIFIED_ORG: hypothetical protein J2W85_004585 [Ensifer adhaerens]|nr:hypothetical protein [Ensifer adhaerens]